MILLFLAQDWPEFRGPTAQGHAPPSAGAVPVEWSAAHNVDWKTPIPGAGWSSPVLHRGRIYLTSAVPLEAGNKDLALTAFGLDAKTGAVVWQREVFRQDGSTAPPIHARNSHASPTPVASGEQLFVHFGHQGTACLTLDGRIEWTFKPPKFDPEDGNGPSPLVLDDLVMVNVDGKDIQFALALDRATGKIAWKTDRRSGAAEKFSYCTPTLIEVNGQRQVISPHAGAVCAYEPKTGREIWRVGYGDGFSVVPRPVFGHGLVYVCTGFKVPRLLAIRPNGQGNVTDTHVAWSTNRGVPIIASLLLVGEELYMISDTGVASCLDAKTGAEHWRQRVCAQAWASPLFADGKIYFQDVQGMGVVIKPGRKLEILARNSLDERTLASYAVGSDGSLFIRTERHLYRIVDRSR